MNKFLKWSLISLAGLGVALFVAFQIMVYQTKKHSPEAVELYQENGHRIEVVYSRPYKKGREIFGGLVPYGSTWRTGANEATTFTTAADLNVGGRILPAGTYTLWTVPEAQEWDVIFNSGAYDWGVDWDGKALRDSSLDVLHYYAPVQATPQTVEQFTIDIAGEEPEMKLMWDNVQVAVPLAK